MRSGIREVMVGAQILSMRRRRMIRFGARDSIRMRRR
jgi:hypothetical protein